MFEQYIQNDYWRFLLVLVASFLVLRFGVFILEKIILKLTVRTKTNLDDLIIEKTSGSWSLLVAFIGLLIAVEELTLGAKTKFIIVTSAKSLIFIVAFYIGYVIVTLVIDRLLRKYSKGRSQALNGLIDGTLKVILIIGGFLALLSLWNVQIGPLLAGIGIGGVAIAFALQSSLGNVFGGISIILDKSVNVGDLVNVEGTSGKIMNIGLRSTKIKTFDNEIVIIPNSKLSDGLIHNVAQPEPKSRVVVPFGVAYGADIEKVKKIVLKEIKKIKGFVDDPEPSVKFLEMADSSLNFKAYFFVDSFEKRFSAIDEANTRIYNALNKAKIEIPFPQMDVHLKK